MYICIHVFVVGRKNSYSTLNSTKIKSIFINFVLPGKNVSFGNERKDVVCRAHDVFDATHSRQEYNLDRIMDDEVCKVYLFRAFKRSDNGYKTARI